MFGNKIALGLAVVAGVAVLGLIVLSAWSRRVPPLGLVDGVLRPLPAAPNAVTTEGGEGLPLTDPAADWARLPGVIESIGGRVEHVEAAYLHATFTTPLLRFVDDLEVRLDPMVPCLHVRSASRVGHSDLGANARRLAALRRAWAEAPGGQPAP